MNNQQQTQTPQVPDDGFNSILGPAPTQPVNPASLSFADKIAAIGTKTPAKPAASGTPTPDENGDIPPTKPFAGDQISASIAARKGSIDETTKAYVAGKVSLSQAFVNNVGQVLGLAFDIPADLVKAALPSSIKDKIKGAIGGATSWASGPLSDALAAPEIATYENAGKLSQRAGDLYVQAHAETDPAAKQKLLDLAKSTSDVAAAVREKADEISTNLGENAKTAEAVTNIGGMALGAGGSADEVAAKAATEGKNIISDVTDGGARAGGAVADKILGDGADAAAEATAAKMPDTGKIINNYNRAIKPSVAGKANATQIAAYNDNVVKGVTAIAENRPNLELTDADGNVVKGQTPESVSQFSDAISQTKQAIFKQYDAMAKAAGDEGGTVDFSKSASPNAAGKPTTVVDELNQVIGDKTLGIANPGAIAYAKSLLERLTGEGTDEEGNVIPRKPMTTSEVQDLVQHYNQSLKAFYRNPTYDTASKAAIDALVANKMRSILDATITDSQGAGYQGLKSQYGALSAIEKDVAKRATVVGRQNPVGFLGGLSDVAAGAEVVRGLMTLNPVDFVTGGVMKGIQLLVKRLNDPDAGVRRLFSETSDVGQPATENTLGSEAKGTVLDSSQKSTTFQPKSKLGQFIQSYIDDPQAGMSVKDVTRPTAGALKKIPASIRGDAMDTYDMLLGIKPDEFNSGGRLNMEALQAVDDYSQKMMAGTVTPEDIKAAQEIHYMLKGRAGE